MIGVQSVHEMISVRSQEDRLSLALSTRIKRNEVKWKVVVPLENMSLIKTCGYFGCSTITNYSLSHYNDNYV